jgi:N-acetylneuraminate synthase
MNTKFVAEMTINHLGMKKILQTMIQSAKDAGASVVKLKLKNVDKYYESDGKKWRNFNFKNYRKSLELFHDDFIEIDKFCKEIDIAWFCTVHDTESLQFLQQFNLPYFKVASMDSGDMNFISEVAEVAKKNSAGLVVSVGGKSLEYIDTIIDKVSSYKVDLHLLHTVSIYPTPIGQSNIGRIAILKDRYSKYNWVKVGYSGHEIGYSASLLASIEGVSMIERHLTLTRDFNIHHIGAGITPDEYSSMVKISREIQIEKGHSSGDSQKDEDKFLIQRDYV